MPVQMTYTGRNFDIVTGASAIVVAGLLLGGAAGRRLALAWNILGLALLLNVIIVAVVSTPIFRMFGDDQLNVFVTYPPFVWLPAVMVLAALAGHLLIFRALGSRGRQSRQRDADDKRIEVDLRRERGGLIIAVRDHGPGISPEHERAIFKLLTTDTPQQIDARDAIVRAIEAGGYAPPLAKDLPASERHHHAWPFGQRATNEVFAQRQFARAQRRDRHRFEVRGHAWAGDNEVASVAVSVDHGAHWKPAVLDRPANRFAWQSFVVALDVIPGYREIWCKATDSAGNSQPILPVNWNPQGYGANCVHRVRIFVPS